MGTAASSGAAGSSYARLPLGQVLAMPVLGVAVELIRTRSVPESGIRNAESAVTTVDDEQETGNAYELAHLGPAEQQQRSPRYGQRHSERRDRRFLFSDDIRT